MLCTLHTTANDTVPKLVLYIEAILCPERYDNLVSVRTKPILCTNYLLARISGFCWGLCNYERFIDFLKKVLCKQRKNALMY